MGALEWALILLSLKGAMGESISNLQDEKTVIRTMVSLPGSLFVYHFTLLFPS